MTRKAETRLILLIVLIMVSLALAAGGFFLFQKEHARNLSLQEELDDISTRQKIAEKKLEESQNTISALGLNLEEAKTQITSLNNDLQQEKVSKQEALAKIEQLKADLEQQKQLRTDLEKKFSQAQKDVEKIQTQLKELNSQKAVLEIKVKDLEAQSQAQPQGVELGKIVVAPEAKSSPAEKLGAKQAPVKATTAAVSVPTGLEAKVLVVNKDYDFVVINVGSKDGAQIGNIFSLYHNNNYIGDVKVEKVHDSMAAAGFMTADTKGKVCEADKAVRKTK